MEREHYSCMACVSSPASGRRQRFLYSFATGTHQEAERVECTGTQLAALVAGPNSSLAIAEDGTVLGWGCAGALLGQEGRWPSPQPFPLPGLRVAHIALGTSHALFLTQNGSVYSVGDGQHGKLGHGNEENCYTAKLVSLPETKVIKQVAVGEQHSLMLTASGAVFAFGLGAYGALGVDSLEDHHAPTPVGTRSLIAYIAAGYNQSFAIDHDGRAYSFGVNGPWLGHNNLSKSYLWLSSRASNEKRNVVVTPRRIGSVSDLKMKSIAVGMKHTLLLTTDGLVYGMGKNRTGCLGLGKGHKKAVWDAVKIDALASVNIEFVGAGERHSVAVSDVGTIYAFGSGRVPTGMSKNASHDLPRPLEGTRASAKPLHVAVGPRHTLILLPSPLLLLPDSKSGYFTVTESSEVDPRIGEMVSSLNLGREGEKIFSDANISFEVLQILTKDDLQELGLPLSVRLAVYNYMQRVPATPRKDSVKATISQNDLSFVNKLGVGAFGDVWEGRLRGTTTVAIKSVRSTDKTSFLAEAQIMSSLPAHPNVVTFFGLAEGPGQLFIITEFMADGSLDKHLIRNQGAVSVESLIQMTKDLAAGMDHLAEHGIIHRDLAARNLLLEIKRSDVYRVKVCDFGLSRLSTEELNPQQMKTIPVRWTAVEVFMGKPYTGKCDVWSFGVTVWEIFSFGALPYAGMATREVVDAVLQGVRLAKPDGCPDDIFTQIILPCLQANPEDRPTFRELYHKLESLFPSQQRTSSSLTTSPTTSNFSATLSHSSSCGGSGGISLSSSPAAAVPTSMAMQVAEEVMASSQSLTALAPYASSSGVTTRSPPSVESAEPSVTPVAPSKTEYVSPRLAAPSSPEMAAAGSGKMTAFSSAANGKGSPRKLLTSSMLDLHYSAFGSLNPRSAAIKTRSCDEGALTNALALIQPTTTSTTAPKEGRPRTNSGSAACSGYSSIPEGMRSSLPLATRRKKSPTRATSADSRLGEKVERVDGEVQIGGGDWAVKTSAALGRRMGIADIDPYQLLRLSESVGGFTEEEEPEATQDQPPHPQRQQSFDGSRSTRKEKTLNRLAWGKFHKA